MDNSFWARMHGGTTHFPVALMMASVAFDTAGFLLKTNPPSPRSAGLHAAGFYALLLGALGSLGAVVSGLMLTRGDVWGRGNLQRHHLFLWPAFALLIALAVWRLAVRDRASRRAFGIYLTASLATAGLIGAAGYWGGELLLNG